MEINGALYGADSLLGNQYMRLTPFNPFIETVKMTKFHMLAKVGPSFMQVKKKIDTATSFLAPFDAN